MANYEIPQTTFDPHPEGEHTGTIAEVIDQGMQETRYGNKYKLTIVIESRSALKDDGEPFSLWVWVTLSSAPKATLTQLRQKLLRRPLNEEERRNFDPDAEMVGKKVRYMVAQNYSDDGKVFANLVSWTLAEEGNGQQPPVVAEEGAPVEAGVQPEKEPLPF